MYISHYDIRLFYKCPMLLYLNEHGPEDEKKIHPIIQTRKRYTKHPEIKKKFIDRELKRTDELMHRGINTINQCWIGFDNKVAKVNRLTKIKVQSNLGSYAYAPTFLRYHPSLRKPLVMEGTYSAYLSSEIQETEIDYFIIQHQNEKDNLNITENLDELKKDLETIWKIKRGDIEISPNYTRGCRVCEWRVFCKKIAAQTLDLTLISGIGKRVKSELINYGIKDVRALAKADITNISLKAANRNDLVYFKLQAESLVGKKEIVRDKMEFPRNNIELFVDVEGSSHHNFIWIIGCLVRKDGIVDYIPFQANSPHEEKEMFASFLEYINEFNENYVLYHWSSAEPQYFKNLIIKYSLPYKNLVSLTKNSVDLFPIFKDKIVLPLYTYTLKDVANWLGFQWHEPMSDGATSIVLFDQWYNNNDRRALEKAVSYNSDDCKALMIAKDYLSKKLSTK